MNEVPPLLDIVIVNWNAGNLLHNCVKSVLNSDLSQLSYNIYIVDNNSSDNSLSLVENLSSNLTIIYSNENLGFGKACNLGVKNGNSPYLLFLNPDTEIFPETIVQSLNFFNDNNHIGILGVKQVDENGNTRKSCSRFLSLKNYISSIFGFSKYFPNLFKQETIMFDWDHEQSKQVDQVMGAYMLMRRDDFENLGGFDEIFFVYFEDMDLAKRILTLNKISFYNSEISIYHKGCGTTDAIQVKRIIYITISKLRYAEKHWSKLKYYILILFTLVFEPITRSIFLLFTGRMVSIIGTLRAYNTVYCMLISKK